MSPWQANGQKKKRGVDDETVELRSYVKQLNSQFDNLYKVMPYWSRCAVALAFWDFKKKGWKQASGLDQNKIIYLSLVPSALLLEILLPITSNGKPFANCHSCRRRTATLPLGRRMT